MQKMSENTPTTQEKSFLFINFVSFLILSRFNLLFTNSLFTNMHTIHINTHSKQTKLSQWSGASKNMRYRVRCSLIQSVIKKWKHVQQNDRKHRN